MFKKTAVTRAISTRYLQYACLVFLTIVPVPPSQAAVNNSKQHDVFAALIIKLVDFVTWPETIPELQNNKANFCILEKSNETTVRSSLLASGSLQKNFNILQESDFSACHLIFISVDSKKHLNDALSQGNSSNRALTFSAGNDFVVNGVMINFFTEDGKVGFEINWNAMKNAGFGISSRVLKLARIVND